MSFLDNVKAKTGTGVNNPFATNVGGAKAAASKPGSNPFAPKTATPATTPKPTTPVAPAMPKTGAPMPKPGAPAPGAPKANPFGAPAKPAVSAAPIPTPAPAEEEPKVVSTEELVEDVKNTVIEEPKAEEVVEAKTEAKEEEKKTKPASKSRAKSTAAKKKASTKAKEVMDTPEISQEEAKTVESIFKMPTTNMKYSDALKAITSGFVDEEWEAFRAAMIEEADSIIIESDMQEGAIKKTIAQLNTLRDRIWVHFCDTKSKIETLSSKETEGLIETVKFASLEGSNDTSRKKSAVLAVMNYKTPEGEAVNLYQVFYETKARYTFLKCLMDTIDYKSRVLITMSSAVKMQKGA